MAKRPTKALGKAELRAASDRPVVLFDVPDLGTVALRGLSMGGVLDVQKLEDDHAKTQEVVRLGLVDQEAGQPLFEREEFGEVMGAWGSRTVKLIGEKVNELSGATKEGMEAAVEGFPDAPSSDSHTS